MSVGDRALLTGTGRTHLVDQGRDPARVEQVVANLVSNALEHAEPGTPVRVRVGRAADRVRLEVSNRGPPTRRGLG